LWSSGLELCPKVTVSVYKLVIKSII